MQKLEILQNIAIQTFIKSASHVGSIILIAMDAYQVLLTTKNLVKGKRNKAYDRVAKQIDELVDIQKHMETLEKHIQLD